MRMSINSLASLTGIDRRTITRRLGDLEADDQGKAGKFYASEAALPLIYGGGTASNGDRPDPATERAMLDRVRREGLEMENQQKRGELIRLDTVFAVIDSAATACREHMMGLPGRWASILAAETDERTIERMMEQEIRAALTHIADAKHADFRPGDA